MKIIYKIEKTTVKMKLLETFEIGAFLLRLVGLKLDF